MKMNILDRVDSAADGKGRKTVSPDFRQDVEQSASTCGAMHIEIDDLVDIPGLISVDLPKWIAQPVVTSKLLAAIDGAVVEQQDGDNAMIEHGATIDSKLAARREV